MKEKIARLDPGQLKELLKCTLIQMRIRRQLARNNKLTMLLLGNIN